MKRLLLLAPVFFLLTAHAQQPKEEYYALLMRMQVSNVGCAGDNINAALVVSNYKSRVLAAGGTMSSGDETAFVTFVQGISDSCLYFPEYAIWPAYGGTAAAARLDLKGNYDLTLMNTPTVNSFGISWNASTQYAKTGLVPGTVFNRTSNHITYYTRTDANAITYDIGALVSSADQVRLTGRQGGVLVGANYGVTFQATVAASTGLSLSTTTVVAGNQTNYLYRNGTMLFSTSGTSSSASIPELYIGAANNNGTAAFFSSRQMAYADAGEGIATTKAAYYMTLVNNLMTALGRNTY